MNVCVSCRQPNCVDPGACRIVILGMVDRFDMLSERRTPAGPDGRTLTVEQWRTRGTA